MSRSIRPTGLRRGRRFSLRFGGGGTTLAGFALCLCLLAQGCGGAPGPEPGARIELQIIPRPPRVGTASIKLKVTDAGERDVEGADVTLECDMTHPGMKPVFGAAKECGPGLYCATLEFTMAGSWVILAHVKTPDGRKTERTFETVVAPTD